MIHGNGDDVLSDMGSQNQKTKKSQKQDISKLLLSLFVLLLLLLTLLLCRHAVNCNKASLDDENSDHYLVTMHTYIRQ